MGGTVSNRTKDMRLDAMCSKHPLVAAQPLLSLCWERIWGTNRGAPAKMGETRRDGWDGQWIATCARRNALGRGATGRLITQRSRYHCSAGPPTEPTMAIFVPKAPGRPKRLDSETSPRLFAANNPEWIGIVRFGPESLKDQYPCSTIEDRYEPELFRPTGG